MNQAQKNSHSRCYVPYDIPWDIESDGISILVGIVLPKIRQYNIWPVQFLPKIIQSIFPQFYICKNAARRHQKGIFLFKLAKNSYVFFIFCRKKYTKLSEKGHFF